jgi:uncharacterized pyridoxal phosphate-containing UPF0001 family protein
LVKTTSRKAWKIRHFSILRIAAAVALYWPLQSNKSRLVAEHFDWCHTVDR